MSKDYGNNYLEGAELDDSILAVLNYPFDDIADYIALDIAAEYADNNFSGDSKLSDFTEELRKKRENIIYKLNHDGDSMFNNVCADEAIIKGFSSKVLEYTKEKSADSNIQVSLGDSLIETMKKYILDNCADIFDMDILNAIAFEGYIDESGNKNAPLSKDMLSDLQDSAEYIKVILEEFKDAVNYFGDMDVISVFYSEDLKDTSGLDLKELIPGGISDSSMSKYEIRFVDSTGDFKLDRRISLNEY